MIWRTIIIISEAVSIILSSSLNLLFLYLIKTNTPDQLKPYSKILRQNVFVDMFFTFTIAISLLQVESDKGDYILFSEGPFKNLPHPWNGFTLLIYLFGLYFCIFSYSIPFSYRYLFIVKDKKMSITKFYLSYVVTAALALSIPVFIYISTVWPGWKTLEGNNASDFEADFDFFWRDENGRAPIFIASHFSNPWIAFTVWYAFGLVLTTYVIVAFFCIKTINYLKELQNLMTESDHFMQKQVTFALLGQATAPLLVGGFPLMMTLIDWTLQLGLPRVGILAATSVSWTSFMNPLAAILLIVPYRKALCSILTNERRWCFSRIMPFVGFSGAATNGVTAN